MIGYDTWKTASPYDFEPDPAPEPIRAAELDWEAIRADLRASGGRPVDVVTGPCDRVDATTGDEWRELCLRGTEEGLRLSLDYNGGIVATVDETD